jgi:hypothetical protein
VPFTREKRSQGPISERFNVTAVANYVSTGHSTNLTSFQFFYSPSGDFPACLPSFVEIGVEVPCFALLIELGVLMVVLVRQNVGPHMEL